MIALAKRRKTFKLRLHPKQKRAFFSRATEILYGGAKGGGKSHLMRVIAIFFAFNIPGIQIYLFRREYSDLLSNHMEGPTSFRALLSKFVEQKAVSITEKDIRFRNGSHIHLRHCQHEKDKYKYNGVEIHILMLDELTAFTRTIYEYLRLQVRIGSLEVPEEWADKIPLILAGSNPGGVGHNWVKSFFITGARPMSIRQMPNADGGMIRQFVPARLADNPTLIATDPGYADRLEGAGSPALVKAMKEGDWNIIAGAMFDSCWKEEIIAIPPFTIPKDWRVDRGFDYGASKPFSTVWFAEADGTELVLPDRNPITYPKGTVFAINEWYGWNGKPNEGVNMPCRLIGQGIRKRETAMIGNLVNSTFKPGPADIVWGKQNDVSMEDDFKLSGIRFTKPDKRAGSRVAGADAVRKYLSAALKQPQEEPGFFIFDTCRHLIDHLPVLPRDENNPDDVDSDSEDHDYDVVRMRLSHKKTVASRQKFTV